MRTMIESDRDITIRTIRAALKRRSGKAWSVKGGTGTSWGWIHVDAPPARRTWRRIESGAQDGTGVRWVDTDTGVPNSGHMSPTDRAELARLLGLESVHEQGLKIPASGAYYREHIDRAEGRTPSILGTPYWD